MNNDELMHYGVKGMKWGVRRYQNEDGSYTNAGRKRYAKQEKRQAKYADKTQAKVDKYTNRAKRSKAELKDLKKQGTNHERVKDYAYASKQADKNYAVDEESTENTKQIVKLAYDIEYAVNYQKHLDTAYKELVDGTNADIRTYTNKAKQWTAANEAVMNMPLDSSNSEYRAAIRRAKKAVG